MRLRRHEEFGRSSPPWREGQTWTSSSPNMNAWEDTCFAHSTLYATHQKPAAMGEMWATHRRPGRPANRRQTRTGKKPKKYTHNREQTRYCCTQPQNLLLRDWETQKGTGRHKNIFEQSPRATHLLHRNVLGTTVCRHREMKVVFTLIELMVWWERASTEMAITIL